MRQTLASQRDSRLGRSGEAYPRNGRWIKEGKVTDDDDVFPWLRAIQIQGFDLPIIGSSLDAVRVCMEAWHAGFKPVLIIIEDPARSKETAEMRPLLHKLGWWHGGAGMFTYGPRIIVSEGPKCLVQLDHRGRAMDVMVRTDNGGLHTLAETWQLFKGPAIIVDDIGTMEEPQANKRSLFLRNTEIERPAVADPKFWEDRYDPERLSHCAVGYRGIAPNLLAGPVQMFAVVVTTIFTKEQYLPDAFFEVFGMNTFATLLCSTLGVQLCSNRPTLLGVSFAVGYWFVNKVLRESVGSEVGEPSAWLLFSCSVLLFCKCAKHMEVSKPTLAWYHCVVCGMGFPLYLTNLLLRLYLAMLSWNRVLASVFLSLAFCSMEMHMVKLMQRVYVWFVWEPRRSQPNRVPGDQKLPLAACVIAIHCCTETGRLVSMVCGAVRAEDATFIYTNAVAVVLSLVINVTGRTGWGPCLLVRHACPCLRPHLARLLCPTSVRGLHIDVKFAMSWLPFFIFAGLCIGRGCAHNKWRLTMTGHDAGVWCWNGIVLVTVFMAFVGEIVEDWLVYVIVGHWPAPQWECFGSAMVRRFSIPGRDDVYHPCHYMVPQSAFLAPSADTTKAPSLKRSLVKSRATTASTRLLHDLAPMLSVSPNFKHARYLSAFQLQYYVGTSIFLILDGMRSGLGAGNLYGFCRVDHDCDYAVGAVLDGMRSGLGVA